MASIHEGVKDFLYRVVLAVLLLAAFIVFGLQVAIAIVRSK